MAACMIGPRIRNVFLKIRIWEHRVDRANRFSLTIRKHLVLAVVVVQRLANQKVAGCT